MPTREHILEEIRRIAAKIGTAPGRQVFENETGIRRNEWHGVHWRSWGDALEDAGLTPNVKQGKLSSDDVLRKYAEIVRHYGHIPAAIDVRMYSRGRSDIPGHTTFSNHFRDKAGLIAAFREWIGRNDEYADLADLLPEPSELEAGSPPSSEGYVYLLKSGDHFKIGRSDEIERRVKEINIALPEAVSLIHSIRTDDPAGIEAYWHRRFVDKRAKGEWFRLSVSDVKAFKRRKFQ